MKFKEPKCELIPMCILFKLDFCGFNKDFHFPSKTSTFWLKIETGSEATGSEATGSEATGSH
jgi:hypothetical protein